MAKNTTTTRQESRENASNTRKAGRPRGNMLEKLPIQEKVLRKIILTGDVDKCYEGIVSKDTYKRFLNKHQEEWDQKVETALEERENLKIILSPKLERLTLGKMVDAVKDDRATFSELMGFYKMLRQFRDGKL